MSAARHMPPNAKERLLAELSPDLLTVHAPDGTLELGSAAAAELLGVEPEVLVGHSLAEYAHPLDRAIIESLVRQPGARAQYRLRHASGRDIWVETRTSVRDRGDALVAVTREIGEQKKREDHLQRTNESLRAFTSTAAHDLKAPLNTVQGYAQLLLSRFAGVLGPDGRRQAERIVRSAARMSALIDDLLTLTNLDSPESTFNPVPLGMVMERVQESLDRSIRESGARVEIGELPTVFGNHGQLEHVFQNLLSNALKFRGDGSPHIRVSATRADNGDVIAVSDNGIGFPAERAEQIFAPFTRLHGREHFEGTGLGLSIVARIVEQHGGQVWARSNPGQGSTFYALFPRYGRLD